MALRVGINGFGRIGRLVLRAGLDDPDLEFVAINDVADKETLGYLLQFDSVHGLMDADVTVTDDSMEIDGQALSLFQERDPAALPWKDLGIDVVIDASGRFTDRAAAEAHIKSGARRVIITAPAKNVDGTFVIGVNEDDYDPEKHRIVSTASCTTQALGIVCKILHDRYRIERGFMTTVHAYTNSQVLVDTPSGKLRRSRAAGLNLVPTSTGAARAIGQIIPDLAGRIEAMAVRCPLANGSLLDLTVQLGEAATAEEINQLFHEASEVERLQDVVILSHDALVSTDIIGTPFSAIVDAEYTASSGNMARILAWYDNEWAYSVRVVDFAALMAVA